MQSFIQSTLHKDLTQSRHWINGNYYKNRVNYYVVMFLIFLFIGWNKKEWRRATQKGKGHYIFFYYLALVSTESAFIPMNKCLFKRICTDIMLLLSKSRGTFYILWTHRHCGNLKIQLRKEGEISSPPQPGPDTWSQHFFSQSPSHPLSLRGRAVGLRGNWSLFFSEGKSPAQFTGKGVAKSWPELMLS